MYIPLMVKLITASFLGGMAVEGMKSVIKIGRGKNAVTMSKEQFDRNAAKIQSDAELREIANNTFIRNMQNQFGDTHQAKIHEFMTEQFDKGVSPGEILKAVDRSNAEYFGYEPHNYVQNPKRKNA